MRSLKAPSLIFLIFIISAATSFADKLDIPVPLNEDVLGIRIPYYDEKGFREMQLDAGVARKTDENHATLKKVKISLFEENHEPLFLELPEAVFDLQTNILYGNHGVTINRQDMNIVANSIVLQTKDRFARFQGRVKMTIFNLDLNHPQPQDTQK